jgi:hypothetical protein
MISAQKTAPRLAFRPFPALSADRLDAGDISTFVFFISLLMYVISSHSCKARQSVHYPSPIMLRNSPYSQLVQVRMRSDGLSPFAPADLLAVTADDSFGLQFFLIRYGA